jgi:hypothetical protein
LFIFSCANQQGKIKVEGADPQVSSNIEKEEINNTNNDQEINIEDNLTEEEKKNKILTEKLIEVGDRVFF